MPDVPQYLVGLQTPLIFKNALQDLRWATHLLLPLHLARVLGGKKLKFRLGRRRKTPEHEVLWETDCVYVEDSLEAFLEWKNGRKRRKRSKVESSCDATSSKLLEDFESDEWWAYLDYKYMKELIDETQIVGKKENGNYVETCLDSSSDEDHPDEVLQQQVQHQQVLDANGVLEAVRWSDFGLSGRDGKDSTLWIGTQGAFTQCHQDAYGCNLVAQIQGHKRWTLFPPEDEKFLYSTRIPYEESTTFSGVNVTNPDLRQHPRFSFARRHVVLLDPGDVLFVPRHWWHHVENLDVSLSINTWVQLEEDREARCHEAITRLLVTSLMTSGGQEMQNPAADAADEQEEETFMPSHQWLNPTESLGSMGLNLHFLNLALDEFEPRKRELAICKISGPLKTCACIKFEVNEQDVACTCGKPLIGSVVRDAETEVDVTVQDLHEPRHDHDCGAVTIRDLVNAVTDKQVIELILLKMKPAKDEMVLS